MSAAQLAERLRERRAQIESAALTRIVAIADPAEIADPAYAEGLRRAIPAAIGFGIDALGGSRPHDPPIPVDLLAQARLAARNGISLDTVLRRYFAGYSLLGFHLIEEASRDGLLGGEELQLLSARQAGHFDRLLAAVAEEHGRESAWAPGGARERRVERVRRLLAGEPVDPAEIAYEFDGFHLAILAGGRIDPRVLRGLADSADCRLLFVEPEEQSAWVWLGARERSRLEGLAERLGRELTDGIGVAGVALAMGEPAAGLSGWRLSHRQAGAALPVARRGSEPFVRYADVALLASVLQDDLLATSLRRLYLEPLEAERDGGETLRETLRAYFACGRNGASAAAALGVSRQTVNHRLQAVEARIGRSLSTSGPELDTALRLAEIDPASTHQGDLPDDVRQVAENLST